MISWISLFYCKCFSCVVFFHLLFFTFFPIDIFKSMSIKLELISRPCYKYCYNPTLGLDFLFTYYIKVLIGEVKQFAKLSLNFFFKKIFLFIKSPILNNILSYLFPDKDHLTWWSRNRQTLCSTTFKLYHPNFV